MIHNGLRLCLMTPMWATHLPNGYVEIRNISSDTNCISRGVFAIGYYLTRRTDWDFGRRRNKKTIRKEP